MLRVRGLTYSFAKIVGSLTIASQAFAASPRVEAIQELVNSQRKENDWPSLSVSISNEGTFDQATSVDPESPAGKVTDESIHGIGSCTKSMAATVLAKTGISRPRMRSIQPARSGEFGL